MSPESATLSPACRAALARIITQAADARYLAGNALAESGSTGPTLEGAVSAVALAQTEFGHARQLYRTAAQLLGKSTVGVGDELPAAQAPLGFLSNLADTWVDLMAALYTVNLATSVVLGAMVDQGGGALGVHLRKLLEEQEQTLWYAGGWVEGLAREGRAVGARLQSSLAPMVREAAIWVARAGAPSAAVAEGLLPDGDRLVARLRALLAEGTAGLNLDLGL